MKLAVHFANMTFPGNPAPLARILADTARAADEGGVSTMTLMDHYFQISNVGPAENAMMEGYTSLGFIAGQTQNLRLGLLVTGVTYRYPGLLAKIVTTLDILSNGRAMLGIGAAWYEREHHALGVPYPPTAERFERLEETLQIVRQMWSDNDGPYNGKHYQLAETMNHPQVISQPHPPILIGGQGERKTLRFVARYGDACNLFLTDPAGIQHKLDVLKGHCDDAGTDYDRIEKTIIGGPDARDDTDGFLRQMEVYAKMGIHTVWNGPAGSDPAAWVRDVTVKLGSRLEDL